jgi:hypothetical protein
VGDIVYNASSKLVTLTGAADPGATVKIYDNNSSLGSVTANSSGVWSLSARVGAGVHSYTEQASDSAGNTTASAGVALFNTTGALKP